MLLGLDRKLTDTAIIIGYSGIGNRVDTVRKGRVELRTVRAWSRDEWHPIETKVVREAGRTDRMLGVLRGFCGTPGIPACTWREETVVTKHPACPKSSWQAKGRTRATGQRVLGVTGFRELALLMPRVACHNRNDGHWHKRDRHNNSDRL